MDAYVDLGGFKVNKYACGTALLQLPFFIGAMLATELEGNDHDGFQPPFQNAVLIATLFYLLLSIFFLKKVLQIYQIKRVTIIYSQLMLVLATAVTNYAILRQDSVMSIHYLPSQLSFISSNYILKAGI
jgi:hypothetical protein